MSPSGMLGTDSVLVLVGSLGLPGLIDSGLDVSRTTPCCPGAMVIWAQHKWMTLFVCDAVRDKRAPLELWDEALQQPVLVHDWAAAT